MMQQSWKVTKASRSSIRNKSRLVAPEAMPRAPCRARSDQKWSRYKEEIRSFYIDQDKTLEDTMQMIDLPASERKWKQQLKEWGFQKNLPASHMAILVAKREQRLRDYGKNTVFLQSGVEIRAEKFETFKKRKTSKVFQATSPSAETPPNIVYHTPKSDSDIPGVVESQDAVTNYPSPLPEDGQATTPYFQVTGNKDEFYEHSNIYPRSPEVTRERTTPNHTFPMQIASDQMDSQLQPLQTSTVPLLAGDSFWTQNEDLNQFNQQTVLSPTFYAHFSPANNQGSQHTPHIFQDHEHDDPAPAQRVEDNFGGSRLTNNYLPVGLMDSTSVLVPGYLGMDPSEVIPGNNPSGSGFSQNAIDEARVVENHMHLAETYGAYRLTGKAEAQYIEALVKCMQFGQEQKARQCLHEFGVFLKEDRLPEVLESSIQTCRNLVLLFERNTSATQEMKTASLGMLADLLNRHGQLAEAEAIYRQILDMSKESKDYHTAAACEASLRKLLYQLWSPHEGAVREQLRSLSISLEQETSGPAMRFTHATAVILTTHFSAICQLHPCHQLGLVLEEMSYLLSKRIWGHPSRVDSRLRDLTMKLALECSELAWHDNTESFFRTQRILLDRLATADWGYVKIRGYIDYCAYLERSEKDGSWKKYIEILITAYKTMEDLLHARGAQPYRKGDFPFLELLKLERAGVPSSKCDRESIQLMEGVEKRLERMLAQNQSHHSEAVQFGE